MKKKSHIKGVSYEVTQVCGNKYLSIIHDMSGRPITVLHNAPINKITDVYKLVDMLFIKENWDITEDELTEKHGKIINEFKSRLYLDLLGKVCVKL